MDGRYKIEVPIRAAIALICNYKFIIEEDDIIRWHKRSLVKSKL